MRGLDGGYDQNLIIGEHAELHRFLGFFRQAP